MIGRLKGLVEAKLDELALVDVNGVVYEAYCSGRTLSAIPEVGAPVLLHIEMVVREDMIRLYGFATEAEKGWFRLLQSVQGVGARVALGVLTTLTPTEIASAIALGDKAMVGRAPGVGPKLAQRIVTELKGKGLDLGAIDPGVVGLQNALGEGVAPGTVSDAVSALVNLGYGQAQASAAVARIVAREGGEVPTEKLIRLGLRELSA